MADYSQTSDADLLALVQPKASGYAQMSDADLMRLVQPAAPSATDQATGAAKQLGVGAAKGALGTVGLIPLASDLLHNAANKYVFDPLLNATIGPPSKPLTPENQPPNINRMFSPAGLQSGVETVTGEFRKPQNTLEKYADTVGEFVPGLIGGPAGLARRAATQVVAPAVASEMAGQLTEGTGAEPYARVGAALLAPAALSGARRLITPAPSSPERQGLVNALADEGVTSLTAGQRTGNKAIQYAESILGDFPGAGQGATRVQQEGQRQFTEAAMRRAGAGPNAAPEVLAANNQRLANEFETLSARNTLTPDNQFINDVTAAVRQYRNVPNSQQAQMIQGYIDDIVPHINAGGMPGAEYQAMRSRLSRQANNNRQSDPDLSEALRGFRNALDNAMSRSISPADREAWQTARREYGAQKTIEKAASRAGEATAEGQIVPANLRNAVSANNRGAYARGEGDFSELARAGSGVMAPLPNSGTSQRAAIQSIISALGGGAGAAIGNAPGAIAGAAAAGAAPALAGRILMSRPVQGYLGNQLLRQGGADNLHDRVVRMLLATQAGPSLLPRP